MTNQSERCEKTTGKEEMDITPEMIEAGLVVLSDYEWGWSNAGEFVKRIYLAMASASSQSCRI